MAGNFYAEQI